MVVAALVFAGLAALLHVYIFTMESLTWTSPRTRAVFGVSAEEAAATKEFAFNQGFYNLFLAIVTAAGIVMFAIGNRSAGAALVVAGAGSMLAAALVLLLSAPDKSRPAVIQGILPFIAVALLGVALF